MVKTHNNQHSLFVHLLQPHTLGGAKQLHGKQLSYNNIKDADAALSLVKQFEQPDGSSSKTYESLWCRCWRIN
ncbi:hypothetical protein [Staphylococcus sp. Mo2-1]